MKKSVFSLSLWMFTILFAMISCEILPDNDEPQEEETVAKLYVKFMNEAASEYTITNLQVRPRGSAQTSTEPTEPWSGNILPESTRIEPGAHVFFELEIPNLHWSQYRLLVDDGSGNIVLVGEDSELPITHWGSDDRTVGVTLKYDEYSQSIWVSGWSDFAGID
ncbi:MAG: hypothetical protein AB7E36_12975 [Salinivirgaceae bacterium]